MATTSGGLVIEVGVDIVEIPRVQAAVERHEPGFRRRVYTELEWRECGASYASLAGRFAAKEAVMKALGGGGMRYREIEIARLPSGKPEVRLYGRMQARAARLGVAAISITISHSRDNAVAVAVAQRDSPPPPPSPVEREGPGGRSPAAPSTKA